MIWNAFLLNKSGAAQAFMADIFAPVEFIIDKNRRPVKLGQTPACARFEQDRGDFEACW
jgi:hypothetical protein